MSLSTLSKHETLLSLELSCPICLQLYTEPVVLPCGHNYCLACIQKATLSAEMKSQPRCPECREEYTGPDALQRNFKLCGIVEGYQASVACGRQQAEVPCDHCLDTPAPAVKACLRCEVALCPRHLQRHAERHGSRGGHTLVDPMREPGGQRCPQHGQLLEYLCASDRALLCNACVVEGSHQSHDVQTFEAAEVELRRALECQAKAVASRLQMTEALLRRAAENQVGSPTEAAANKLVAKAGQLLDGMAELAGGYRVRMAQLLQEEKQRWQKQRQGGVGLLEEQRQLLREAQQGAGEAQAEPAEGRFILRYLQLEPRLREAAAISVATTGIPTQEPAGTKALRAGLRTDEFRAEMGRLLSALHGLLNPLELTFNPATAHPSLLLSNDLRTAKYSAARLAPPEHTERFASVAQVLCQQGFSRGQHVWAVELGASSMWSVGLCYRSMPRRGDHSRLGHNSGSWRLQWKNRKLTACHASINMALADTPATPPQRVEVALDCEGGTLAFHSTRGRRQHLHTFRAAFRETVYPAFAIHSTTDESWITLQNGV